MQINRKNYYDILTKVDNAQYKLSKPDQILINQKVDNESVSLPALWIIWLVFGIIGGDHIYMRDNCSYLMLILMIIGILTIFAHGYGIFIILALMIWKLVDACFLNRKYHYSRLAIRRQLVKQAEK